MKKIFFFLTLLLIQGSLFADELQDVGIAKYAVLEVLDNNTPLRMNDNEFSQTDF